MNKILDLGFEIKAVHDSEGIVEGRAAAFTSMDFVKDIIMPGAFKRTLKQNKGKFPVLSHHNMFQQIGFNVEASEDDKGLNVKAEFDIKNNVKAIEHFSLIEMALRLKQRSGFSIGFRTIKDEFDSETEIRKLLELKLFEWSPVTFPANEDAFATDAKSAFDIMVKQQVKSWLDSSTPEDYNKTIDDIHSALDDIRCSRRKDPSVLAHSIAEATKQFQQFRKSFLNNGE